MASLFIGPLLLLAVSANTPDYEPVSAYEVRKVEGWTVHVNKRLLAEKTGLAGRSLKLLQVKLYDINRLVPAKPLAKLHAVPIWLELDNDKFAPCAQYHPSKKWLQTHGFNPIKAKSVEISSAQRFLTWSIDQPFMILHELAHAYHDRVLGFQNKTILSAYRQAVASKSYDSVLRINGRKARHYALTNAREYFAESTEAWFGTNDFYPFVRAELQRHDPTMVRVLKEIWGK